MLLVTLSLLVTIVHHDICHAGVDVQGLSIMVVGKMRTMISVSEKPGDEADLFSRLGTGPSVGNQTTG